MTQKRILIADDSSTIRRVVTHAFAGTDVDVLTASNGSEALEVARSMHPDLILCDVLMPELSGYEVVEALQSDHRMSATPIVLLTGAFEPFDEERCAQCGAKGHLSKPFETHVLIRLVEEHLANARDHKEKENTPNPEEATSEAPIPASPNHLPPAVAEPVADESPLGTLDATLDEREGACSPTVPPLPGDAGFDLGRREAPIDKRVGAESSTGRLSEHEYREIIQAEVRREIRARASSIIREVAWEVVPDLLERVLRETVPGDADKRKEE